MKKQELIWKDFALFFASLVFISMGSTQYLILSLLMLILYTLCLFVFEKERVVNVYRKIITYKKAFFWPAVTALTAFIILYFPHLKAVVEGKFILLKRADTLYKLTPSLSDYILPNSYLRLIISKLSTSTSLPSIEKIVFIGWVELLFFLGFIFSPVKRNVKKIIFLLFILPFVLSLGYGQDNQIFFLPYRFISDVFPFSALIETSRYVIIFYLFITCAILLFLNSFASLKTKYILITILLLGAFLERIPTSYNLVDTLSEKPYIGAVKKQDSLAVLDLPINYYYAPYNILSLYYDKAIVNGYFHWSADSEKERSFINDQNLLNRYICDNNNQILPPLDEEQMDNEMLKRLAENNITTIVVHKDDKFLHTVCDSVRARLNKLLPKTTKIFDEEAASVYTINSDNL